MIQIIVENGTNQHNKTTILKKRRIWGFVCTS